MFGKVRILLSFVVVAVVLLIGCTTTSIGPVKGSYPETPDGQCKISASFDINSINGDSAYWEAGMGDIIIPAGKHTISGKTNRRILTKGKGYFTRTEGTLEKTYYDSSSEYVSYQVIWEITYEFQKGKDYYIRGGSSSINFEYEGGDLYFLIPEGAEIIFDKGNRIYKPKVEVSEYGNSKNGPFITPEATGLLGAGFAYGGITLGSFGERFGIGILNGKMDLKIVGLAQTGVLMSFTDKIDDDVAHFGFQYNFGVLVEQHFPKIGIGAGGGMGGHLLIGRKENEYGNPGETFWTHDLFPYLELNIMLRRSINLRNQVIYFHYYPTGEKWFTTFGLGWKTNLIN